MTEPRPPDRDEAKRLSPHAPESYQRFRRLTKRVLSVPKEVIDEREQIWREERKRSRGG